MTPLFVFPGQNSRYPEMIDRLRDAFPEAAQTLTRASDAVGRDLAAHHTAANDRQFSRNRDVQIGVFLTNFLWAELLKRRGVRSVCSLGLSLGEYNHLVDIGALSLEQALPLIEARGVAYEGSPRGAMAAVFPLSEEEGCDIIERVDPGGEHLAVGMRNSPRQQVFSGEAALVEQACGIAEDEHFAQAVLIEDRLPMHSPLFHQTAIQFGGALDAVDWSTTSKPYLSNALGSAIEHPVATDFKRLLREHLYRPVLWRQSVDAVAARFDDAIFIEVGPKSVLTNLLRRRWVGQPVLAVDAGDDISAQIDRIQEACEACIQTS